MSEEPIDGSPVTQNFVKKVFKAYSKDKKVEVISLTTGAGSGKGDNVMSTLIAIDAKVKVNGKEEEHHMLVKRLPQHSAFVKDFANSAQLFTKEVAAYKDIFPYMVEFQKKRGAKDIFVPPVPRFYDSFIDGERDFIVVEDVRPRGFKMQDRFKGLSFEESCLALRELARLHAISYGIRIVEGRSLIDVFPTGIETIVNKNNVEHGKLYTYVFKEAIRMMEVEVEDDGPQLAARMRKLQQKSWDIILAGFSDYDHPLAVLNHGDVWVNNILYKYEDDPKDPGKKRPVDVMFIDFQMTRVIPLTLELTYFFYTSTTRALRKAHAKEMLMTYWNSFLKTLREINVEPPPELTYEVLRKELQDMLPFGLIFMCFAIPMQLANPEQSVEGSAVHKRRGSGMFDKEDDDESMVTSYLKAFAVDLYKRTSSVGKRRLVEVVREVAERNGI